MGQGVHDGESQGRVEDMGKGPGCMDKFRCTTYTQEPELCSASCWKKILESKDQTQTCIHKNLTVVKHGSISLIQYSD